MRTRSLPPAVRELRQRGRDLRARTPTAAERARALDLARQTGIPADQIVELIVSGRSEEDVLVGAGIVDRLGWRRARSDRTAGWDRPRAA